MFQTHESVAVGFDSVWKSEKSKHDSSTQTSDVSQSDHGVTTVSSTNSGCQADFIQANEKPKVDYDRLAAWLNKIYPKVIKELDYTAIESRAFYGYKLQKKTEVSAKFLYSLANTEDNRVSALSWNCTGNTLAIAYSQPHETWCHHSTFVSLYTADKNGDYNVVPSKKIPVSSCVTTLSLHLTEPAIIAGGTVTGDVIIWSTLHSDTDSIRVSVDDCITQLMWHKSRNSLFSADLNADLIEWEIGVQAKTINVKNKYKIQTPDNIKNLEKPTTYGIVCFSFSHFEPETIIIALEGGKLLRCDLITAKLAPGDIVQDPRAIKHYLFLKWMKRLPTYRVESVTDISDGATPRYDPVIGQFDDHEGTINGVQCSPHHKDLFLSYDSDSRIHIYNIDQESPIQVIYSEEVLNVVNWVPGEERLIAGCCEKGLLKFFGLKNGKHIEGPSTNQNVSTTFMCFNCKNHNLFATGDNNGVVQIWNIQWNQYAEQLNETLL